MNQVRLDTDFVDYAIVVTYFIVVLGIGFAAKRYIQSSLDYFLSGRSLPAWITGLAFISANLGATEVLGMAANGAQYGVATVNYYWIGAIPAMVFLGLVMMPFYYGSKVRSRPGVPAPALQPGVAQVQLVDVRAGHDPDRRREPVRARAGPEVPAGLADHRRHHRGGGHRRRLHHARRPVLGDLQRGAAVLRDPRGADPDRVRRPARRRRLDRPAGQVQAHPRRRGRPARAAGHGRRQRGEPDRRVVDRDRVRARLRARVRLLDDELRRGAARAVGEGHLRRPAHAADRRDPEALPAVHHDPAGHDRARRDPQARDDRRAAVQQRRPAADEQATSRTGCSGSR